LSEFKNNHASSPGEDGAPQLYVLWKLKNSPGLDLNGMEKILLKDVTMYTENKPVRIDSRIVDLLLLASEQNFVPVVDDQDIFIGIVRRREIIEYCSELIKERESQEINN